MSKILYVEDKLDPSKIKQFFGHVLSEEQKTSLGLIQNKERFDNAEIIRTLVHAKSCLDIGDTLLKALNKIIDNFEDYDLIVLDRNLKDEDDYTKDPNEIIRLLDSVGISNPQEELKGCERFEGDLLLKVLLRICMQINRMDLLDRVFYFTAYATDELRTSMKEWNEIGIFKKTHIIAKLDDKENLLTKAIADIEAFTIQNKYRDVCEVLRTRFIENENMVNHFIILFKSSKLDIEEFHLIKIRNLLEGILNSIAKKMDEPEASYWDPYNKEKLIYKHFIKGGYNNEYPGLQKYNREKNIYYTSIIRNAMLSIYEIVSDYGAHLSPDDTSKYTVDSLLAQLCDVILWFDKAMESFK